MRPDCHPELVQSGQNNFCWQSIPLHNSQWKETIHIKVKRNMNLAQGMGGEGGGYDRSFE